MGSITLNKPSGGQLTLSPEDGATNETVTIPSVGVGKVLDVYTIRMPSSTGNIYTASTSYASTGLSLTVTPKSITSKFLVFFSSASHVNVNTPNFGGSAAVFANNTNTLIKFIDYEYEYGVVPHWVTKTVSAEGEYSSGTLDPITFEVKAVMDYTSSGTPNAYYFYHQVGGLSTPYLRIMEVAQ